MFKEFRQDTYFEVYGRFMFPEVGIEDSTAGKIIYKRNGRINSLTLEVYGLLETNDFDGRYLEGRYGLYNIVGFTNYGMSILIEGAVLSNGNIVDSKFSFLEYNMKDCLFLDLNIDDFEPIVRKLSDKGIYSIGVSSCQYSFTGIDKWVNESNVFCTYDENNYTFGVDFDNIKEDFYLVDDENLKFSSGMEISSGENTFNEEFYWSLESIDKSCFDIKSILGKVDMFKELLEILLSVPIDYSYLKFRIPIGQLDNKLVTGYLVRSRIRIDEYKKFVTDIPYEKIKDNFEDILCKWFENINEFTLIVQNYIINKNALQYNQSILLNSIKNLEMYHRNFVEQEKEINESLNRDKRIVLECVDKYIDDKKHIEKFISNINYDSEMTLYNWLLELFGNLNEDLLKGLIRTSSEVSNRKIKTFAYKLVSTRNYYTHGDSESMKNVVIIDSDELIETTLLLNQIIKYYICKELFDVDGEIVDIIIKGMSGVIK